MGEGAEGREGRGGGGGKCFLIAAGRYLQLLIAPAKVQMKEPTDPNTRKVCQKENRAGLEPPTKNSSHSALQPVRGSYRGEWERKILVLLSFKPC